MTMYLLRVHEDVLTHLKALSNQENIQARGNQERERAAALARCVAAALRLDKFTELAHAFRVELVLSGYRKALLWEGGRIVGTVEIRDDTLRTDIDRAYCMAYALPLRQIVQSFLRMDCSPTVEMVNAELVTALARAPDQYRL